MCFRNRAWQSSRSPHRKMADDQEQYCGARTYDRRDEVGRRPVKTEKEREKGRVGPQMAVPRLVARPLASGRVTRKPLR